jgi:hypothetical protein
MEPLDQIEITLDSIAQKTTKEQFISALSLLVQLYTK